MESSTAEHKTEMRAGGQDFLKEKVIGKRPGSKREVTLEEYWLHCMEENHHKLDQLKVSWMSF